MIRLRNGIGWIDIASGRCALPPDGETFAIAPGAPVEAPCSFHIVEAPQVIAVVRDPGDDDERTRIESALANHVEHTAFVQEEREGFAAVHGHGASIVLATAVAALKAIGGWDESVPITISVDGEQLDVRLSYDGSRWTAAVTAVSR